jgi:uncharacterized protein (DUF885 family)
MVVMRSSLPIFLVALLGCPPPPQPPASGPQPAPPTRDGDDGLARALDEAARGVSDEALATLLRDHWRWVLENDPLWATELGVHAFDDRLADHGAEAIARRSSERRDFLERAEALAGLTGDDELSRSLLVEELEGAIASEICAFERWAVDARHNPVTVYNRLPEDHPLRDASDYDRLLSRYRAIPRVVDQDVENLARGAASGLIAPAESLRRVLAMVTSQLAQPLADWPLLAPLKRPAAGLSVEERAPRDMELRRLVDEEVRPALARYAALLERLLPEARPEEASGLGALPVGEACYRARITAFTTLPLDAAQIHAIGLEEIARTDAEMQRLGEATLGTKTLEETLARLRSDRSLYFENDEQVEALAEETLAAAKAKMGAYFGVLPQADCVVKRIPDYEAPYTTIAYYRPPHADGAKPGEYFVNVFQPETRPRYEARVLAVHEAIPGHHLQIAISQELPAMPAFRKHGGFTAFVEGWALYTERLGDEMGLYESDLDRIGMVSFDAWRAGRLVVDAGIHAFGWSRGRAKAFLEEHTALSRENIDNEVDRYINWPGQALAYKLGEREIRALRGEAERALGDRFSLVAFHDAILGGGAMSLPALRRRMEAFAASAAR